jgi:hypothetical protein
MRSPRNAAFAVAAVAAIGGAVWYLLRRPRPNPEEVERARRELLASSGRITDGSITEAPSPRVEQRVPFEQPSDPASFGRQVIVYNYRIAGVTYKAAQDVTALSEQVKDVRTDLPVQVRYEPHNPANSIVVAEGWSGLRLGHPHTESR